jgi:uncharacterized membrane protein
MADKANDKNPLLKALLGNWLGHPLHPAIVHLPIALWLGSLVFDALTLAGVGGNHLVRTSYWAILLGLATLLIVVPAGLAEWSQIKRERPAWTLALWHMILNVSVAAILAVSLYFRSGDAYLAQRIGNLPFLLNLVANGVLLVSGYLGGRMVYQHGIGVARLSKKKWRKLASAGHANLPPEE